MMTCVSDRSGSASSGVRCTASPPHAVTTTVAEDAGLTVLQVARFPVRRQWSIVWRRDQPRTAAARRFVAYLQERSPLS